MVSIKDNTYAQCAEIFHLKLCKVIVRALHIMVFDWLLPKWYIYVFSIVNVRENLIHRYAKSRVSKLLNPFHDSNVICCKQITLLSCKGLIYSLKESYFMTKGCTCLTSRDHSTDEYDPSLGNMRREVRN